MNVRILRQKSLVTWSIVIREIRMIFILMFKLFRGKNLLEIPARNPGEYGRSLLKLLFDSNELQTSLLPSTQSKRFSKPELDRERFNLLNGTYVTFVSFIIFYWAVWLRNKVHFSCLEALRTRYRITKYHYIAFYKDRIQETLAGCLYNQGPRKLKHRSTITRENLIPQSSVTPDDENHQNASD